MARRRKNNKLKRDPPERIKRILRREGRFGCIICGCPIIQYHHIIPWKEKKHHQPKHMAILCLTHHTLADNKTISQNELYKLKKNAFNKKSIGELFNFKSRNPGLILGNLRISWFSEILRFDDYIALSISISSQGYLLINSKRYDKNEKINLEIINNEWKLSQVGVWDVIYKGKLLKIWDGKRDVGFELQYLSDKDEILLKGNFKYKDRMVRINTNGIFEEKRNIGFSNFQMEGLHHRKSIAIYVSINKPCPKNNCMFCI